MSLNNLHNQKRQIIDCSSWQTNQDNNESRRNQSQQDFYQMKKNNEKQKLSYILNKDPMQRATLAQKIPQYAEFNTNQDPLSEDIASIKQKRSINSKQQQGFFDRTYQNFQKQIQSKSSIFDSKCNSNKNLGNIHQNNGQYNNSLVQNQNSKNKIGERQSTGQQIRSQNIQSLNNIELDESKYNNQVDSFSIVSNHGRQIVHSKVKKTVESNLPPPTFFTTPQYKTTTMSTGQSEQDLQVNSKIDPVQKQGIFYSYNQQPTKNQYQINTKSDQIFASFIPCFSVSSQAKHRQTPLLNQSNNQSNALPKSKCSTSQSQTRSSQNLDYGKEFQSTKKYHQVRSNQTLDEEKRKLIFQSQNEAQQKLDLFYNLFTQNKFVKSRNMQNGLKQGFQKQPQRTQNRILREKYEYYYPNGDQVEINNEQNDPFYDFSLSKNLSRIDRVSLKSDQSDKMGQFLVTATTNATDQPDTCSSQADNSFKHGNVDNILDDNIVDENRFNQNSFNLNQKYDESLLDKNNWKFQKNDIIIPQIQVEKVNQNKEETNSQNVDKPENKNLQRLNSLHFLDEADNNNNQKLTSRKYHAASYTKLPSTCQLGRFTRNGMGTTNNIKSTSEISSQKELQIVDEKKMLEDYRQYQLRNKLDILSKSVAVYDVENQQFILNVQGNKLSQIASLTKIMTCYIVCDLINRKAFKKTDAVKISLKQNQTVKISKIASKMKGTSAFLRNGDELSLWSLLHGLMLPSGNDAALAISEHVGSIIYENTPVFQSKKYQNPNLQSCNPKTGQREFIRIMNVYAEKMKLKNTYYQNPHGLNNNKNKSCATDLCILVNHAMKNSYFREIVKTTDYTAQITNHSKGNREITWENTQKLLKRNKYCNGVKTGITPAAGPCLASSFTINNRNFIIVILKTTSMEMRFAETMSIFKFIVEIYELDKEKKEEISKELIYQPDQENIIEKKYLKKGWEITSANNLISTHELDDDDKYSSDEDDIDYEGDEDDIIGSQDNSQNALSINSKHKLSDKVDTNDQVNQNFVQNNQTELNQNIYNMPKKGSTKQLPLNFEELIHQSKKDSEQNSQFNKLLQDSTKKQHNNLEDKQLYQQYNQILNSSREKQLTKINEEDF